MSGFYIFSNMDCIRQNFDDLLRPLMDIHILVVDDDATTLSLVSAMLKTLTYKVISVKNPLDALAVLRTQKGLIDLVVTDLHMPYMNGFQLQEQLDKEFQLPVIVMSADDKDTVLLQSAQCGVTLFIQKPVSLNDLKNVWQYAIKYKKGKSVVFQETNAYIHDQLGQLGVVNKVGDSSGNSVASVEEDISFDPNKINNQHISDHMGIDSDNKNNGSPGGSSTGHCDTDINQVIKRKGHKKKVVWTNSLHNRFLLAIGHLSLDKAVPKKILELMNIPGLTRENVASHLQKYRLFLKKVAENGLLTKTQVLTNRMSRSTFATGYPQELALQSLITSCRDQTPFRPLNNQFYTPYNYNISMFRDNIWPSSSSSPCLTMSNNLAHQHRPIQFYDRLIYETNHFPVGVGGGSMACNDPHGLVNYNSNYSNGFKHSSAFNGIVQNHGGMRGPLLGSTNDAPYYNSITGSLTGMTSTQMNNGSNITGGFAGMHSNGMFRTQMNNDSANNGLAEMNNGGATGSLVNMYSAQMSNGGAVSSLVGMNNGCVLDNNMGRMNRNHTINGGGQQPVEFINGGYGRIENSDEMSTFTDFTGTPQTSQPFETPYVPSSLDGLGSGASSSGINPSLIQPIVSASNVSYLKQQDTSNYIQPSPMAAPSPAPAQPPLQHQYSDAFQNLKERCTSVEGDYQMVDRVINNGDSNDLVIHNKGISTDSFAGELPLSSNVDDIDSEAFLDQLNNLSPLNFQIEVMSPSSENKNPVVDELSGNFQVPYIVQENEVPAIDTNGQSFSQKQGIEEVLDSTEQFINFPTINKLNEMDWDEFLDNMLDNKYPGPLE